MGRRRWLGTALVALGVGLFAQASHAENGEQELQLVTLGEGLDFAIPASFKDAPELKFKPRFPLKPARVFSDDATAPLQLYIFRGPPPTGPGLPPNTHSVTQEYASGFAEGLRSAMKLLEVYEVAPGKYDDARGAFSVEFMARAPSRAKTLLEQDGLEGTTTTLDERSRCYLSQLLGDDALLSEQQLTARRRRAVATCGGSTTGLQDYVKTLGPDAFAARETALMSIAFFTRSALLVNLIVAPPTRTRDAAALSDMIWKSATVQATARLHQQPVASTETDAESETRPIGVRVGRTLASLLGVVVTAGLLSILLNRRGLSARRAVWTGFAAALSSGGALLWVWEGATLPNMALFVGFVLALALAYRPWSRWLRSGETPIGADHDSPDSTAYRRTAN